MHQIVKKTPVFSSHLNLTARGSGRSSVGKTSHGNSAGDMHQGETSWGVDAPYFISLQAQLDAVERESADRVYEILVNAIKAISMVMEKRDPYTAVHQSRVADLAVAIAIEMEFPDEQIKGIRLGAIIHDIGKIYVPSEILNRPGKLTKPEFDMIKSHTQIGMEIIEGVSFPWPVVEMVYQHHERLDGSGYPLGLKGDEITIEAQIISVADMVEAITSHRPYRASLGIEFALKEIQDLKGIALHREAVNACLTLFKEKNYTF